MMNLPEVSKTAIVTLTNRAIETEDKNPVFKDPMAVLCLEKIISISSEDEKNYIKKVKRMFKGVFASNRKTSSRRALYFDNLVNEYILKHPSCTVINLACGFDTRFWRIDNKNCKYYELDFPEVIALKKELLKEYINYEQIGCSVLETSWIDKVTTNGNKNFLLIAEGLFMYLPKQDAIKLLKERTQKFVHSQIAFDIFQEKYTRRLWKKFFGWSFKKIYGIDASIEFGFEKPQDIESFSSGFKVMDVKEEGGWYFIAASINENA